MEGLKVLADMEAAKVAGSPSKAEEGLPGAGPDQRQHPEAAPTRSTEELMMGAKREADMSKPSLKVCQQVGFARRQRRRRTRSCCCCRGDLELGEGGPGWLDAGNLVLCRPCRHREAQSAARPAPQMCHSPS